MDNLPDLDDFNEALDLAEDALNLLYEWVEPWRLEALEDRLARLLERY